MDDDDQVASDVAAFRDNRIEAAQLQKFGKVTLGNRKADRSQAAYERLITTDEGKQALVALLHDSDPVIRMDVAGRLLPDPRAMEVLERWADSGEPGAEGAALALKYFRMRESGEPS